MNLRILILLSSLSLSSGAVSAQKDNVLHYWRDTGYSEVRNFFPGRQPKLVLDVNYHEKYVTDSGHDLLLFLKFAHRDSLQPGRTYNVATDTAAVRVNFQFLSVWIWNAADAEIVGTVKVIRRSWRRVIIGFDLKVDNKSMKNKYV